MLMYNTSMAFRIARQVFGILLLASSLVVLTWGMLSAETLRQSTQLSPAELALPDLEQTAGSSSGAAGDLPSARIPPARSFLAEKLAPG